MVIIKTFVLANEQINLIKKELLYKTSRSGGKGGQNVNKVESKVEISFNILHSIALTDAEKQKILAKLKSKLTEENILKVISEKHRTQLANKEEAVKKLISILNAALKTEKIRKATKPGKASKEKRIESKKKRSEIKSLRKKIIE